MPFRLSGENGSTDVGWVNLYENIHGKRVALIKFKLCVEIYQRVIRIR